jgi:PAS domain S-box-containing protein
VTSERDEERRVVVLAPAGRDVSEICAILAREVACVACHSAPAALAEIARGAGALVIEHEALTSEDLQTIHRALDAQETWSDLPLILLAGRDASRGEMRADELHDFVRNVTVLERPVLPAALLHTVQSALRARDRQYASRELIRDRESALAHAQQATEALLQNEQRFRSLVTASSQVLYCMSPDWREMRQLSSEGFLASTERPSRDWLTAYIPPDEQPRVTAAIDRAIRDKSVFELEHRVKRKDGTIGWTASRAVPLLNASGDIAEWFGAASDITDRKRAEEEIQRLNRSLERRNAELDAERARWQGVVEGIAEEVWICDAEGKMTLINLPEETAMGLEEFQDKAVEEVTEDLEILYPDGRPRPPEQAPLLRSLRTGEIVRGEEIVRDRRSGRVRYRRFSCAPTRDAAGAITGAVAIASDVTENKRVEQALREADRQKSHFLGVLSHELRNPLAPIRNSLYILERVPAGGEQANRALQVIDRQVHHVIRLVDDLLDVTRITSGKIQLRRERLELRAIARGTAEDHREIFSKNGIELEFLEANEPVFVSADPTRVAQVIGNLLQNAAKFTPRGGRTTLSVGLTTGHGVISVQDTGVGIAPAMLPRLFEPFVQADSTLDRSTGGLGLGLALVKGLVELQGGTVSVSSEGAGKGSTFVVRFPLELSRAPRLVAVPADLATRRARRVLLIEDNIDAAGTLKEILEMNGHAVDVAYTGLEGVEKVRALRPDIVICDLGLPGMDGFQVARMIRGDPDLPPPPLIAVSGYGQPEDLERSRAAGFDAHLTKPVDLDALERTLLRLDGDVSFQSTHGGAHPG